MTKTVCEHEDTTTNVAPYKSDDAIIDVTWHGTKRLQDRANGESLRAAVRMHVRLCSPHLTPIVLVFCSSGFGRAAVWPFASCQSYRPRCRCFAARRQSTVCRNLPQVFEHSSRTGSGGQRVLRLYFFSRPAVMSASAVLGHLRRITYRFHSSDVRKYALADTLRRATAAVTRAGGLNVSGLRGSPTHIKRWVVLRSPHVNKTSREHFWKKTYKRSFQWDAPATVSPGVDLEIPTLLPANVATRIVVDAPALARLRGVWETMQSSKGLGEVQSIAAEGSAAGDGPVASRAADSKAKRLS